MHVARTFCHCGTGKAGSGSKHLADVRATLPAKTKIDVLVMVEFSCTWNAYVSDGWSGL